MLGKEDVRTIEQVSASVEEQQLSEDELMPMLRQMLETRALEDNIAGLLSKTMRKGASHL